MTRFRFIYTFALVAAVALLGSCQKEEIAPQDPTYTPEETYTQYVDLSADIEDIDLKSLIDLRSGDLDQDDELRMSITDRVKAGVKNGVNFVFDNNETVKLHLLFKQGNTTAVSSQNVTVTRTPQGKFKIKKENLGVPSTINLARGGVSVTGAIGVKNPRVQNGQLLVDVPSISTFLSENPSYVVPMYFPMRSVESLGGGKYGFYTQFKFYGSIVGIPVENGTTSAYRIKSLDIVTPAFQTEGTINLTNTASADPSWTSRQADNATKSVTPAVKGASYIEIGAKTGTTNTLGWHFFWVKAKGTVASGTKMTIDFKTDGGTSTTPQTGSTGATVPIVRPVAALKVEIPVAKALKDLLVHRTPTIKVPTTSLGGLIITEVHRGDRADHTAFEFYNNTDRDVYLWDYKLVSYNGNGTVSGVSPLLEYSGVAPRANDRCAIIRDMNKNFHAYSIAVDAVLPDPGSGYLENEVVLKPGRIAMFVGQALIYKRDFVEPHQKNTYGFNYKASIAPGFNIQGNGGYIELVYDPKRSLDNKGQVVDVFLKFQGGQKGNMWAYTMTRKPDCNTARTDYMRIGSNSEWLVRSMGGTASGQGWDWGARFSYYMRPGGSTANDVRWTGSDGLNPNGAAGSSKCPFYDFKVVPNGDHSFWNGSGGNNYYVNFPSGWTEAVAKAS